MKSTDRIKITLKRNEGREDYALTKLVNAAVIYAPSAGDLALRKRAFTVGDWVTQAQAEALTLERNYEVTITV
jgi:hypothetical protein